MNDLSLRIKELRKKPWLDAGKTGREDQKERVSGQQLRAGCSAAAVGRDYFDCGCIGRNGRRTAWDRRHHYSEGPVEGEKGSA